MWSQFQKKLFIRRAAILRTVYLLSKGGSQAEEQHNGVEAPSHHSLELQMLSKAQRSPVAPGESPVLRICPHRDKQGSGDHDKLPGNHSCSSLNDLCDVIPWLE